MVEAAGPPLPLGDAEVHDLWSNEVGDTFRVFVGHCGPQPGATLYVTDANGLFGMVVDTIRLMQLPALLPDLLVVGIGYPGAATVADTLAARARDLTPTPSPLFARSGGAHAFLRFVRGELRAWVEQRFPSSLERTVYFGHSLGGLLGVVALLDDPPTFDDLILSSPSLWWDHHTMLAREEERAAAHDDLVARVYVGIGALETDPGRRLEASNLPEGHASKPGRTYLDMVDDVARFTAALQGRGYPSLEMSVAVFPDEFHATVAGTVLSHGLRRFFHET